MAFKRPSTIDVYSEEHVSKGRDLYLRARGAKTYFYTHQCVSVKRIENDSTSLLDECVSGVAAIEERASKYVEELSDDTINLMDVDINVNTEHTSLRGLPDISNIDDYMDSIDDYLNKDGVPNGPNNSYILTTFVVLASRKIGFPFAINDLKRGSIDVCVGSPQSGRDSTIGDIDFNSFPKRVGGSVTLNVLGAVSTPGTFLAGFPNVVKNDFVVRGPHNLTFADLYHLPNYIGGTLVLSHTNAVSPYIDSLNPLYNVFLDVFTHLNGGVELLRERGIPNAIIPQIIVEGNGYKLTWDSVLIDYRGQSYGSKTITIKGGVISNFF